MLRLGIEWGSPSPNMHHPDAPPGPPARLDKPAAASIVHHMAKFQSQLDRTFAALTDPTRRAILARLEHEGSVSIGELARPLPIKLPAVMKHLDVLATAGLVTRAKTGRVVAVRLAPDPMQEAMTWLRRYERFWSTRLDRLAAYAEAEEAKATATDGKDPAA
jgi:DNA-binding transcriptional ArsR family regulator